MVLGDDAFFAERAAIRALCCDEALAEAVAVADKVVAEKKG